MPDVHIRPMRDEDVVDAAAARCARGPLPSVPGEEAAARAAATSARASATSATDPGGRWVAEHDGRVEGVALALIREGIWGFSLFGVARAAGPRRRPAAVRARWARRGRPRR